ncbi:HAMP domain-containing histidine kinase [Massilia sp. P8910]|uniref:sensor histidine kinase n=1 Tax=Massilia antarctica TaxID=2765360 RepID=UPI001E3359C0|nr:HAMP domain-containing sensor histidine kinase [Massilia antarctica]MCE3603199.1 HAMP domain-containing histidine kinase [Massilia antarctica]
MSFWSALSAESRDTFWRSLQALTATRIVISLVLLAYLAFDQKDVASASYHLYTETCMAYLVLAGAFVLASVYVRNHFLMQVVLQIAVDIAVISVLYMAAEASRGSLVILYLFPLAGAAILAPRLLALFSAALVTLFLLTDSLYQVFLGESGMPLTQAGLYGAAFFAIVMVVSRLAARLIRQEELAARHGADLKIQQAINQIIIADVDDGILVVDRDGHIFAGNPAAQHMLGLANGDSGFALSEVPALEPVAFAFSEWQQQVGPATVAGVARAAFVTVKPYRDSGGGDAGTAAWSGRRDLAAHLKLRFARVDTVDEASERCVIFLQDVTAIENQAQELKLASMGRLTASIAHEVRNPLSAIGHATALLAEDLHEPGQARLLKIVGDNVARVNRMVEDILQLSRKVQPNGDPLLLGPFLNDLKAEFDETQGVADDIVWLGNTGAVPVRFDALHLREVLINLLTNALRYASGGVGSIRVYVVTDSAGGMELHVQDDGPGITPDVRAHLFEPFYTTSSKGTGLGLYLARELCLNNAAMLDYEYRFDASGFGVRAATGRFVISFAQPLGARGATSNRKAIT